MEFIRLLPWPKCLCKSFFKHCYHFCTFYELIINFIVFHIVRVYYLRNKGIVFFIIFFKYYMYYLLSRKLWLHIMSIVTLLNPHGRCGSCQIISSLPLNWKWLRYLKLLVIYLYWHVILTCLEEIEILNCVSGDYEFLISFLSCPLLSLHSFHFSSLQTLSFDLCILT